MLSEKRALLTAILYNVGRLSIGAAPILKGAGFSAMEVLPVLMGVLGLPERHT
jgi:hypothetical protein